MWQALARLSREARPRGLVRPSRFDVVLASLLVPCAVLEGALRAGLRAHLGGFAFAAFVAVGIWQRRPRPLLAMALWFAPALVLAVAAPWVGPPTAELMTPAVALLIPYSLLRWGSGAEICAGLVLLAGTYVACLRVGNTEGSADAVGGAVVLLFPAAVGLAVRFRAEADRRMIEGVRLEERGHLARDLHDTVAHHVSAIAIQAQAGRMALATKPAAAAAALDAIDGEARRALRELRGLVRSLRDTTAVELAPQPGLAAVADLGRGPLEGLPVRVEIDERIGALAAVVEGAVYRIAQEATTNARRHARSATHVLVRIARDGDLVRLVVQDDGARAHVGTGFGLIGMRERAALLGGTLEAGPTGAGGFRVVAELPVGGGRT